MNRRVMDNFIERLTTIRLLKKEVENAGNEYKKQKEILKQKERECVNSRRNYINELIKLFNDNPITIAEFIEELEKVIYEENLNFTSNIVTDSELFDTVRFVDLKPLNYLEFKTNPQGKFSWILNDENSVRARKIYFFNLLNTREYKPLIVIKIMQDKKVVARFSLLLDLNQKFSDNSNILDKININYTHFPPNSRSIRLSYEISSLENMEFSIPEKFLLTREQMGTGIKPETLIEILENIINKRELKENSESIKAPLTD